MVVSSFLLSLCASSYAQDYYGGGNGSWRKRPDDKSQQKEKDKDKQEGDIADPSGYMSINFGFANPEGNFGAAYGSGYGDMP